MPSKTRAEIQRAYRQRKLERRDGPSKKKEKKTRAEIQREYRERKKQADRRTFLEKERERKRGAYTPTALLSESAKAKRRKENREKAKRFREKLTRTKSTWGSHQQCSTDTPQLIIKMDFRPPSKRAVTRKRVSRGISKANRTIKRLEGENSGETPSEISG